MLFCLPQNADACRQRALEAADQIGCLHDFAHASDPSDLPPLFHDDSRLAEAAVRDGAGTQDDRYEGAVQARAFAAAVQRSGTAQFPLR